MKNIGQQRVFDPLDYGTDGDALAAKAARDEYYRDLKKAGIKSKRFTLRNQLRKYGGYGVECSLVRDVYYIQILEGAVD